MIKKYDNVRIHLLCVHKRIPCVYTEISCACTALLCMHKRSLVFTQEILLCIHNKCINVTPGAMLRHQWPLLRHYWPLLRHYFYYIEPINDFNIFCYHNITLLLYHNILLSQAILAQAMQLAQATSPHSHHAPKA